MSAEAGRLPPDDEAAIRALLARLYEAWARGDGTAYAACFTEECDYITYNGMHLRRREENAALHDALFRGALKGTKLSAEIVAMEQLSPGVVLLLTEGSRHRRSTQTFVVVKTDAGWLIRSFQSTRVQPFNLWLTRWLERRYAR
jgi:uncharacterized protein (TIGR02246 family)